MISYLESEGLIILTVFSFWKLANVKRLLSRSRHVKEQTQSSGSPKDLARPSFPPSELHLQSWLKRNGSSWPSPPRTNCTVPAPNLNLFTSEKLKLSRSVHVRAEHLSALLLAGSQGRHTKVSWWWDTAEKRLSLSAGNEN